MMADVLCSGSSRKPVVRGTPMVSSGCSSANSFVWSSRLGTRGISKRVAQAAIFLVEEVADMRRIVARDSRLLADALVRQDRSDRPRRPV